MFFMVALLGAFVGLVVGAAQSWVWRNLRWIGINIVAWSAAMVASAFLSELVPWGPYNPYVLGIETFKGGVVGLLVGAMTLSQVMLFMRSSTIQSDETHDVL